jgi:hypothetical protein
MQATGLAVDASLPDTSVGGALPFLGASFDGVRPVLRVPVRAAPPPGGVESPTVVALPVVPLRVALRAQDALLGRAGADTWTGSLQAFARFWQDRLLVSADVRAARAGGRIAGWFVRLSAPRTVTQQALVAPFPVAYAATGTGRALPVRSDGQTIVLPAFRTLVVQVAASSGRG